MANSSDASSSGASSSDAHSSSRQLGGAPALVATDLDGTFLSPDGSVSQVNREAVRQLHLAGIPFVVTTGRPPRWLGVLDGLEVSAVVASNGALLWDLEHDRALRTQPVDAEVVTRLSARIRQEIPGSAFAVEQGQRFGWEPSYHTPAGLDRLDPELFVRAPLSELVAEGPLVKLLVQHRELGADELAGRISAIVGDELTVTHSSIGEFGLVEISAPGVTKAAMLATFCAGIGIERTEVAAFGDMPNDLAMLTWVGMPHVMADAHPDLVDLDALRIGSCADSAVGHTILGWL